MGCNILSCFHILYCVILESVMNVEWVDSALVSRVSQGMDRLGMARLGMARLGMNKLCCQCVGL